MGSRSRSTCCLGHTLCSLGCAWASRVTLTISPVKTRASTRRSWKSCQSARSPSLGCCPRDELLMVNSMPDHGRHTGQPRFLIFVIAYHAETTLRSVLERIPRSVFATLQTEVLVVDDASADRTFEIGSEYRDAHPEMR